MNTGVRPTRGNNRWRFTGKSREGFLNDLLYPQAVGLTLPTNEGAAMVFQY
jgi:hypothetical protein